MTEFERAARIVAVYNKIAEIERDIKALNDALELPPNHSHLDATIGYRGSGYSYKQEMPRDLVHVFVRMVVERKRQQQNRLRIDLEKLR